MEKPRYFGIGIRISREPTPEEHVALRKALGGAIAAFFKAIGDSQDIPDGLITQSQTIDNSAETIF